MKRLLILKECNNVFILPKKALQLPFSEDVNLFPQPKQHISFFIWRFYKVKNLLAILKAMPFKKLCVLFEFYLHDFG